MKIGIDAARCIDISRYMEKLDAIEAFAALAQTTRMDAFRTIVMHEPDGIAAGEVSRILNVPQNTMSTHLAILSRAGLISSERQGRLIIYRVSFDKLREAISFLLQDCCVGHPDICAPLIGDIIPCCTPRDEFQNCKSGDATDIRHDVPDAVR